MIILGDPKLPARFTTVVRCDHIDAVKKTLPGTLAVIPFDQESLGRYPDVREIIAVEVKDIREFLYVNACGVGYAVASLDVATLLQPLADHYLTDTKLLVPLDKTTTLEAVAKAGIDGILLMP